MTAKLWGYQYQLVKRDGSVSTWTGKGYLARDIAETAFKTICDGWIAEELPPPPPRWQFWREDIERPDPAQHVFSYAAPPRPARPGRTA